MLAGGREHAMHPMVTRSFWSGRRVLVTGHTGFKGAWLCLWLQELGAEVTGFSRGRPSKPALFDLAGGDEGMRSIEGDIRDLSAVEAGVASSGAEVTLAQIDAFARSTDTSEAVDA